MALTVDNVLDEKVQIGGHEEVTVRQYFARVMALLWGNEESFNGYNPFGNSEWGYGDICSPLAVKYDLAWEEVETLVKAALAIEAGLIPKEGEKTASEELGPEFFFVSSTDAEHLWSYEEAPEDAGFVLERIDILTSNRAEDRSCFVIRFDGVLFAGVYYSGLADSYWENDEDSEGTVTFTRFTGKE